MWSKICYHVANTFWNQTIFNNKTYFSYHIMKKTKENTLDCATGRGIAIYNLFLKNSMSSLNTKTLLYSFNYAFELVINNTI